MAKKSEKAADASVDLESETQFKAPEASTALAVAAPKALARIDSDGYSAVASAGGELSQQDFAAQMAAIDAASMENVNQGEIQVSRISIAQPGTPEVAESKDGWVAGQLYDSMSREVISIFGKPPWLMRHGINPAEIKAAWYLPVVTFFKLPTEYVLWPSKDERQAGEKKFHWKDLDQNAERVREGLWPPKGTWVGEGSPPVTETLNLLGYGLDEECNLRTNLIISSYSRTSYPTGRKLVSSLAQHRANNLPWWGRVYYLFTSFHKSTRNEPYYVIEFAKGPRLLDFGVVAGEEVPDQNRLVYQECFRNASMLSDKATGRALQEAMLNMAQFSEDYTPQGDGGDAENGGSGATQDPF